jgi:hypothetical protein
MVKEKTKRLSGALEDFTENPEKVQWYSHTVIYAI